MATVHDHYAALLAHEAQVQAALAALTPDAASPRATRDALVALAAQVQLQQAVIGEVLQLLASGDIQSLTQGQGTRGLTSDM
jgi:hypothetical protein